MRHDFLLRRACRRFWRAAPVSGLLLGATADALRVAKTGLRMEKSVGDPDGLPGPFFNHFDNLHVRDAKIQGFTQFMRSAVLDRPVVNQTDLKNCCGLNLKWTPDEIQFSGMGLKVTPPTDASDASPPMFTAIQKEFGLKLNATRTAVPVLVVDHVEKPSGN